MAASRKHASRDAAWAELSPPARALSEWLAARDWDFRTASEERGVTPSALYRQWLEALGWNQSLAARIYRRPGTDEPVTRQAIEAQMKRFGVQRPPDLKTELAGQGLQGGLDAMRDVNDFIVSKSSRERLCCEQLLELAQTYQRLRDHDRSRHMVMEVVELARRIGAPEIVARAILPLTYSAFQTTRFGRYNRDTIDLLDDWMPIIRSSGDPSALALALAYLGLELFVSPIREERQRGRQVRAEADEIAERCGDPTTVVNVRCIKTVALSRPDQLQERLELMQDVVGLSAPLDVHPRYVALYTALTDLVESARFAEAERVCEELRPLEELCSAPWPERYRATLATLRGEWDEAQRLCTLRPGVPRDSAAQVLSQLQFETLKQTGDWENLESLARWNATRDPSWIGNRMAWARVLSLMGRGAEITDDFAEWSQDGFGCLLRDLTYIANLGLLAEICHELNDRKNAAVLYALLEPYRERMIVIRVLATVRGPVARCLGCLATTLGEFEQARADFEIALDVARRAQARPYLAWTQYDYARMLSLEDAPGAADEVTRFARDAAGGARSIGMAWLARRADELVRS